MSIDDIRASNLKEGDGFREYGSDEFNVAVKIDGHGDSVLVTTQDGGEFTFDIDEVIERADPITLTLKIENIYVGSDIVHNTVTVPVPEPDSPEDRDDTDGWAYDYIYPHTGSGQEKGDAGYFVWVTASSNEQLIPVGTEWEWGT